MLKDGWVGCRMGRQRYLGGWYVPHVRGQGRNLRWSFWICCSLARSTSQGSVSSGTRVTGSSAAPLAAASNTRDLRDRVVASRGWAGALLEVVGACTLLPFLDTFCLGEDVFGCLGYLFATLTVTHCGPGRK